MREHGSRHGVREHIHRAGLRNTLSTTNFVGHNSGAPAMCCALDPTCWGRRAVLMTIALSLTMSRVCSARAEKVCTITEYAGCTPADCAAAFTAAVADCGGAAGGTVVVPASEMRKAPCSTLPPSLPPSPPCNSCTYQAPAQAPAKHPPKHPPSTRQAPTQHHAGALRLAKQPL